MANNILSAVINVTAPNATQATAAVSKGLDSVASSATSAATAVKKVDTVVAPSLDKVRAAAVKLNDQLPKTIRSTNTASNALINLGRVAQDAPFGIIGIANNLNPLLESFQRTAKEAGSFGATMKALGASLLGGGGLGLALSVVTGALSFFALRNRSSKEDVDAHKKSVDAIATAQKAFADAINKASGEVLSQANNIKDLRDLLISTDVEVKRLTQSTINLGLARVLFDEKNVEAQKLLNAEIKKALALRKQENPFAQVEAFSLNKQTEDIKRGIQGLKDFRVDPRGLEGIKTLNDEIDASTSKISGINQLSEGFSNLFKQFVGKPTEAKIQPVLLPLTRTSIEAVEQSKLPVVIDWVLKPIDPEQATRLGTLFKSFQVPVTIKPIIDVNRAALELQEQFKRIIETGLGNIAVSIGEAIGDAISGKSTGLQSIVGVLGDLLIQIGKALIQVGIAKSLIDKLTGPGGILVKGGVAIIAGIAAVAAGKAFKNFGASRATGGQVMPGVLYRINERGEEGFIPNTGGRIVPHNQMASFAGLGSAGGQHTVVFRQQGTDLVGAITLTNAQLRRLQ